MHGELSPSPGGKTYTIKTLLNTLGISRNTLRYYEQIGVIAPERDPESGYRVYTNEDVFSVTALNMLKNAGYEVQDAQVVMEKASYPSAYIEALRAKNNQLAAWHEAMREAIDILADISAAPDGHRSPHLVMAQPYLMYHDGAEVGYDNLEPDAAQNALIRSMPVASFGSVIEDDLFAPGAIVPRWGRVIPERWAELLPELTHAGAKPRRLGGRPCIMMNYTAPANSIPGFDPQGAFRAALRSMLQKENLAQDGPLFTAHALPVGDTFFTRLYLPVRGEGLKANRMLRRLAREGKPGR